MTVAAWWIKVKLPHRPAFSILADSTSSVADLSNIMWEVLQAFFVLLALQATVAVVEDSYHLLTLIAQCSYEMFNQSTQVILLPMLDPLSFHCADKAATCIFTRWYEVNESR